MESVGKILEELTVSHIVENDKFYTPYKRNLVTFSKFMWLSCSDTTD